MIHAKVLEATEHDKMMKPSYSSRSKSCSSIYLDLEKITQHFHVLQL